MGRTIVMVFNLKPAKLMGIESNGMVLAASPDGGKPLLVGVRSGIPPGCQGSLALSRVIDSHCHLPGGVRDDLAGGRRHARAAAGVDASCASFRG